MSRPTHNTGDGGSYAASQQTNPPPSTQALKDLDRGRKTKHPFKFASVESKSHASNHQSAHKHQGSKPGEISDDEAGFDFLEDIKVSPKDFVNRENETKALRDR